MTAGAFIAGFKFRALIPDKEPNESEAVYRWRQNVAFTTIIIGGLVVLHVMRSLGLFFWLGLSGYATAAEVSDLQQSVKENRITQVENAIKQARTLQCQAVMEANQRSMDFAYEQLQKSINDYQRWTGFAYRVPDCRELIPSVQYNLPTPTPTPSTAHR